MTNTPPDPDSGAAGTEYQTISALRALGHEVDALWADAFPRRIRHGNLHYLLELPRKYRAAMLRRLEQVPYDVVHASQPHGYLAAQAARQLRRRGHGPVFVHRSHGFEPRIAADLRPWAASAANRSLAREWASHAMSALLENNNRGIARYAHGHIVSSSLCSTSLRGYGVPAERIAVIPQGIPSAFHIVPPPTEALGLDRLLYVGQFAFVKGPHVLAQAFETIAATQPNVTLTWVCAAAHHQAARSLFSPEVRERVRLLDWMPQNGLLQVYDDHGVFLFPSLAEGFGKALVEAMARGLVVIASDQGAAHDTVRTGENGIRVAAGDAHAIAQAYLDVRADPARARRMAEHGRESVRNFTWEHTALATEAFYGRLIAMQ